MQPEVLIVSNADPRKSGRVAEAIRVAAGLGAWKQARVHLFLAGPAVLALDEFADELTDGNLIEDYLKSVREHGGTIYVNLNSTAFSNINTQAPVEQITLADLPKLLARVKYTLRF